MVDFLNSPTAKSNWIGGVFMFGEKFIIIYVDVFSGHDTLGYTKGTFIHNNPKKEKRMATYKHLSDLLKICSVLPALAIMPAMATTVDISCDTVIENKTNSDSNNQNAAGLTLSYGDKLSTDGANNVVFKNNSSVNSGGAMKALNGFVAGDGWTFTGNHSDKISGGLYVKIPESYAGVDPENINRDVVFGKNTTFSGNSSDHLGGALGIESAGTVTIGDNAKFESNSTDTDGGAIAIWTDASNDATSGTELTLGRTDFTGNKAANRGGAIANLNNDDPENATDFNNTVNIASGSTFTSNSAAEGGAIYNLGTMDIGAKFTENTAKNGGAIYNSGILKLAENLTFSGNKADNAGGAIYNAGVIDKIAHINFKENEGKLAGAINNSNLIGENQGGYIGEISNSQFIGNKGGTSQGGAIRNQGRIAKITDVLFSGNTAGNGGALNNGTWGSLIDSVTNVDFIGNVATGGAGQGGAIVNAGKIALIDGSDFSDNHADVKGGAIANVKPGTTDETKMATITLKDTNFTGNIAGEMGGAIYNHERGEIVLNGKNTFSGNMAGSVANDIHNDGKFSIASGTTTLDGGITGDGTLTLASGATLNIGSAKVVQKTIDLNGDIVASIVNANSFGQFVGDVDLSTDSELTLDVGAAGEYSIFGNAEIEADKITYNDSVFNLTTDGNKIVVSTKSVDEIMENTNLSMGAANAINIMANAKDDVWNTISLRAQQDMVAGKTGNAEKELSKLNPDDKPVAQSVASSVQNQVLSLAAGRMSGASVGRSGGDLTSADYGMWVQGLYNHSKYNGRFSGDTMGISVGADTLINGKYTLGIGYAYNDTDVDSNSRDTAIESHSVFLYGQYKPNEWYVNAALNYTMSNYTESADVYGVKLADAEYDVNSFGGQIMTGYDFVAGNPVSIFTPEVGVRYLHVAQDAYQGTLGDVDALDTDYLTGVAGVKYAFEIESASELKFRPELRAAATYDFLSDAAVATVNAPGNVAYVIDADRLSRFGGEFGIGLTAQYRGLDVSLNYELDLHEDYTSQTGMVKFRYDF